MDKKSFDTMKNGYNRYQVDDYISLLSNENEELKKKQTVLLKQVEEMEKELAEKQQEYNKVMENLAIREKAAGEMARIAMKEANMVVDTAQKNADAIVKESLIMARGILLDIARLGNEANELKGSMKDELRQLEAALDEFETPNIPNMDLLKKEL
ncbi:MULTISPECIES: DivIVA domain-containing protein [Bacillota]|jgi:cell division initiation protein|uniref:DivIVA domain-containing protein n=1 Tax=Amedibacillus hominis TaxID=2897776 RepID=A0ABS9R8P1_9FIRM|nr:MULTISPECIES: DivIVA domain-containing protein [Bacillota]MCH4286036.1 DivIVA domain-containing protein [Amedibacillus hominis]RGB51357.1 cell division protein DivIVA [Absiella sp. AM22-9]RGB57814.1 cell division protein DivIVA [Absiella sp. AM10-20]RGB65688.1 cell division protein DivIVA [Absiella sp. AM09-45]RGB76077.1 cell division protein DivIVA [Absiella sp. AM09-50]